MTMRVVVTGATGFIGSRLAGALAARGDQVWSVVRSARSAPAGCPIVWDLTDARQPAGLPDTADVLVHAAQSRNYRNFPADAPEMFSVNVAATERQLEWGAKARLQHFIQLSSGTVYEPYDGPLAEDAALRPVSYLAASKLAAEQLVQAFASQFTTAILRIFFPYGPGQADRLLPNLVRRVREGVPLDVGRDGEGMVFTPTYVDDIVDVVAAAIDGKWQGLLNVAAKHPYSIRQAGDMIASIIGTPARYRVGDYTAARIVADVRALEARYDLRRFRAFQDGLQEMLAVAG
jgi:nucleoside-diphosphate-sugar epimerase